MTGSGAKVVRATVMALIALLLGRMAESGRYDSARFGCRISDGASQSTFCFLTLRFNYLFGDARIDCLESSFYRKLSFITDRFKFRRLGGAPWRRNFVLPFDLYNTGALSLGPPGKPAGLAHYPRHDAGLLATVLAFVSPIIALPLSAVASVLLHYQVGLGRVVSDLPFGLGFDTDFPFFVLILMYVVLLFVVLRMQKGLKQGWRNGLLEAPKRLSRRFSLLVFVI